jgi:hypothetical protein
MPSSPKAPNYKAKMTAKLKKGLDELGETRVRVLKGKK